MGKEDYNLERFVSAQKSAYPVAQSELHNGKKRSHWMWYIFPQLKQLGFSYNSKYYGVSGIEEADSVFARVLDKYFAGCRDRRTLALLGK